MEAQLPPIQICQQIINVHDDQSTFISRKRDFRRYTLLSDVHFCLCNIFYFLRITVENHLEFICNVLFKDHN